MPQQSILVVDDEKLWHLVLGKFLGGAGYKVSAAATCAEGVRLVKLYKPDCILLDFHLTDGDAVSVCSILKADEATRKIPVIVFSSDPDVEITAYAQCHADYFLLKGPRSLESLLIIIGKILRPAFLAQSDA